MKSLTLNLPEELCQSLEAEAQRSRVSVEDCVVLLLQSSLKPSDDSLVSLVEPLKAEVNDLSDRHTKYVGDVIAPSPETVKQPDFKDLQRWVEAVECLEIDPQEDEFGDILYRKYRKLGLKL